MASHLTLEIILKTVLSVAGATMGVIMLTTLEIAKATRRKTLGCHTANAAEETLPP